MPQNNFFEPELYLIQKWRQARDIEDCISEINDKCFGVLLEVVSTFKKRHPKYDFGEVYHPGRVNWSTGDIAVGKSSWRMKGEWPISFWLENLGLDHLSADDKEAPLAAIWLKPIKKEHASLLPKLKRRIEEAAKQKKGMKFQWDDSDWSLWFDLPEGRQDLRNKLLSGSSKEFIECLLLHLETLASFADVIDGVVSAAKVRR